jgi:hypothetical protein
MNIESIEKKAMDLLKDRWSHLYISGYPEKPFPKNYEHDLNIVKLGILEGILLANSNNI